MERIVHRTVVLATLLVFTAACSAEGAEHPLSETRRAELKA